MSGLHLIEEIEFEINENLSGDKNMFLFLIRCISNRHLPVN